MHLHWLKPLLGRPGPFVTVLLDATPSEVAGESTIVERWRSVRRELERDGAPAAALDAISEHVVVPDGRRAPRGRVIVADADGVLVDRALRLSPARNRGVVGPAPDIGPLVRAAEDSVDLLLVVVDRTGADLYWSGGTDPVDASPEVVEGGHDEVHKLREGPLGRRGQTRAEDSWQRNAEVVAAAVDARVRERYPQLVVLTGDVRAVALVKDALGQQASEALVEVPGGGRGDGVHQAAFHAHLAEALDAFRVRRRSEQVDRFREAQGRGEGAVTGIDDVVEVLRRGQVDELVVLADTLDSRLVERTLWVGPEPLQVATSLEDLTAIGVAEGEARRMSADLALLRAVVGQDAGVTYAGEDDVELVDSVGAVLRWADGSTPSDSVPTQSADRRRLRTA